jgi:hypothetical protein
MSKLLISLLRKLFPNTMEKLKPTTVASAVAALEKSKRHLLVVEAKKLAQAHQLRQAAEKALADAEAADVEAARATKVGNRLHALLN